MIRETVLGYSLKSAAFDLKYDKNSDKFIFTTYGHGHGVGLSQYGAKALAENGYTYKQILQIIAKGHLTVSFYCVIITPDSKSEKSDFSTHNCVLTASQCLRTF